MNTDPMVEYPATTDGAAGYGHPVTDRGRRLSDAYTIAYLAGARGEWIAARLSDGGTDGQVYTTKADAVRHQLHETQCAYVRIGPAQMPPHEASAFLELAERIYHAGYRLSDPDVTPMLTTDTAPALNRAMRRANARRRNNR